jgi:NADH-quinone oxidoreductase subunit M
MIVAILYLYSRHHEVAKIYSFDYLNMMKFVLTPYEQLFCFGAFALAFCIKVPLFPLHTWLPDAHVEAPTAGSVILAAVLLKFGTYGLLRFAIPLFPNAFAYAAPLLAVLSVVGIVYASLVAYAQKDIKKMIAYSSVAHLGFVVLGISMWSQKAIDGAMFQMLAHGVSTGGLFLAIGALYDRRHTRKLDDFGGVAQVMPRFAGVFLLITMASIGLPGTSGFVGEFLVLIGTFDAYRAWPDLPNYFSHPRVLAVVASSGVVLSAVYMLYLYQKVMFGPLDNARNRSLKDLNLRESLVFAPMVVMALWLGIYPSTFLSAIDPAVARTMAEYKTRFKVAHSIATPQMIEEDKPAPPAAPPLAPAPEPQRAPTGQEIIE